MDYTRVSKVSMYKIIMQYLFAVDQRVWGFVGCPKL